MSIDPHVTQSFPISLPLYRTKPGPGVVKIIIAYLQWLFAFELWTVGIFQIKSFTPSPPPLLASDPVDSVEARVVLLLLLAYYLHDHVGSIIIVPNILFLGLAAAFRRAWMESNSICVSIKSARCQLQTKTNSAMSLVTLECHNTASRGFTQLLLHRRVSPAHKILVGAANRVAVSVYACL